jgi:hypothetical protein
VTYEEEFDSWSDQIYVYYPGEIDGVEGGVIKVWGEITGVDTHENVAGEKIPLPGIEARYVENALLEVAE